MEPKEVLFEGKRFRIRPFFHTTVNVRGREVEVWGDDLLYLFRELDLNKLPNPRRCVESEARDLLFLFVSGIISVRERPMQATITDIGREILEAFLKAQEEHESSLKQREKMRAYLRRRLLRDLREGRLRVLGVRPLVPVAFEVELEGERLGKAVARLAAPFGLPPSVVYVDFDDEVSTSFWIKSKYGREFASFLIDQMRPFVVFSDSEHLELYRLIRRALEPESDRSE